MIDPFAVTSPTLAVDEGIVRSPVEFSNALTLDLTDSEIQQALKTILPITKKWQTIFINKFARDPHFDVDRAMDLVDQMEREVKETMMEKCQLLVSVDVTPLLEGQPIVISFEGALASHSVSKYGFDHEAKEFEVKRAVNRQEAYYGEKGPQHGAYKRRDRGQANKDLQQVQDGEVDKPILPEDKST
jgi:hypothetical protein